MATHSLHNTSSMGEGGPFLQEDEAAGGNQCPQWLRALVLQETYFSRCQQHKHAPRNECNRFCLDCVNGPLCSHCLSNHRNHHTVQIRRASRSVGVRVSEIKDYVDLTEIQTYINNRARIVFLKRKPQDKLPNNVYYFCQVCRRSLFESTSFCSLACKFVGHPQPQSGEIDIEGECSCSADDRQQRSIYGENKEPGRSEESSIAKCRSGKRRRRKGVPHRAPAQ